MNSQRQNQMRLDDSSMRQGLIHILYSQASGAEQLFLPAPVHLKWNQTIGAVERNHPADNYYLSRFLPGAELRTQCYGSPTTCCHY